MVSQKEKEKEKGKEKMSYIEEVYPILIGQFHKLPEGSSHEQDGKEILDISYEKRNGNGYIEDENVTIFFKDNEVTREETRQILGDTHIWSSFPIKNGEKNGLAIIKEVEVFPDDEENGGTYTIERNKQINFVNGLEEGSYISEDDNEKETGQMHNGMRNGVWSYYNKISGEVGYKYFINDVEYSEQDYSDIINELNESLGEDLGNVVLEYILR